MSRLLSSGARFLIQRPSFTVPAVLILAAGLGAATAVFTLLDTVLLRPLPYPGAERIVGFWGQGSWSSAELDFLRENLTDYEAVGAFTTSEATLHSDAEGEAPRIVSVAVASHDVFKVLATPPALGRALRVEDEVPGTRVVMVSDAFWRRELGADPGAVGRVLSVEDHRYEIVGVMPAHFRFPASATEMWFPLAINRDSGSYGGNHYLDIVGRLERGVSLASARAQIVALVPQLQEELDLTPGFDKLAEPATVEPWVSQRAASARAPLWILTAASGLLLLVACANIANLLLAQAVRREREMAIRTALGADRKSLIAQLVSESLMLAAAASVVGLLLAWWAIDLLRVYLPAGVPRVEAMALDGRIFAFAAGLGLLTAVLFSSLPALHSSRTDLRSSLLEGTAGSGLGRRRSRLRWLLVAGEMALAGLLTVLAVSSMRSFLQLQAEDPGFDRAGVVSLRPELSGDRYREREAVLSFYDGAIERLAEVPGVESAGAIWRLPIAEGGAYQILEVEGHETAAGETPWIYWRAVAGDYFRTLRIPLLEGAIFDGSERADQQLVGIVNEGVAKTYWPGESAIGKRLKNSIDGEEWVTVVGVVGDVRHESIRQSEQLTLYRPLAQSPSWVDGMALVARTTIDPSAALPALRAELQTLAPEVPVHRMTSLDDVVTGSIAQERLAGATIGIYGLLALGLAAVGVFGLLAFTVGERRREICIRMALGAAPPRILRNVVLEGMAPALLGIVVGIAMAWITGRYLESFLYQISAQDPLTLAVVVVALLAVALAACWLPARRATRVQPALVLRDD